MNYNELICKSKELYSLDNKTIEYLIKYLLKIDETDKLNDVKINDQQLKLYFQKLEELKEGKPIQYVLGGVNFYGYNYIVNPSVLIPRFETEELVYNTNKYIKEYFKDNISVIDVGTGSGVVGLSLKKENPKIKLTLTDISEEALKVAQRNAETLKIDAEIYKSDMLNEVIGKSKKYDVIVSNPPYIREDEEIMDIVKKYEPSIALYGGKDGLKYYDIILSSAKKILNNKALIAFEIGENQAEAIKAMALKYFNGSRTEIKKDMEGRNRMFFLFYNLND